MRPLGFLVAAAALAFASAAAAGPVTLAPISLSTELQTEMTDNYGDREGAYLQRDIADEVAEALARHGGQVVHSAPITVEITLVDARPNRPTFKQLGDTIGLDYGGSVSLGGAELHAVLRGASGATLGEVHHRRFSYSIEDSSRAGTWGDARRAIRQFATKVGDAFEAQTGAAS